MIKYFSILPIAIYLLLIYWKYGKQKSISDSYYKLIEDNPRYKWFYIVMFLSTVFMFITTYIFNLEKINAAGIVLFLAGTGILFVPAAAKFKLNNKTNTWHISGAISGYVLGYVFGIIRHGIDSLFIISLSLIIIFEVHNYFNNKERFKLWVAEREGVSSKYINPSVYFDEVIGLIVIYLFTIA